MAPRSPNPGPARPASATKAAGSAAAAIGGIARGILGRVGGGAANVIMPMGSMLGDAIMSMLDCDEQEKAATATEEAIRGGNVGDSRLLAIGKPARA